MKFSMDRSDFKNMLPKRRSQAQNSVLYETPSQAEPHPLPQLESEEEEEAITPPKKSSKENSNNQTKASTKDLNRKCNKLN
jgi:hypothetical protein